MKNTPVASLDQELHGGGKIPGIGGGPDLIVDDLQGLDRRGLLQDGLHEILAVPAVQPGRPDQEIALGKVLEIPLALQLGGPVDVERRRRVLFAVGGPLPAVEDVIGAEMDERDPPAPAGQGDIFHTDGIDGKASLPVRLATVHVRIGGGVDHDLRRTLLNDTPAIALRNDVEGVHVPPRHIVSPCQAEHQIAPQHPLVAQYENPHRHPRIRTEKSSSSIEYFTSLRYSPCGGAVIPARRRSFAARIAATSSGVRFPRPTSTSVPTIVLNHIPQEAVGFHGNVDHAGGIPLRGDGDDRPDVVLAVRVGRAEGGKIVRPAENVERPVRSAPCRGAPRRTRRRSSPGPDGPAGCRSYRDRPCFGASKRA